MSASIMLPWLDDVILSRLAQPRTRRLVNLGAAIRSLLPDRILSRLRNTSGSDRRFIPVEPECAGTAQAR